MNIIRMIKHYISYIPYWVIKPKLNECIKTAPDIVVSFTTYPARINCLPVVVGSIVRQSLKPDLVVLYLSKEQFEDLEHPIFISLKKQGVIIKLVDDDLRSHKKYYYAMQEYPNSVIITIDDDVVYDKNMIRDLYQSYKKHPHAVSSKRVHGIKFDKYNRVLSYNEWEYQKTNLIDIENHELIATGCGGVLYPPKIFNKNCFNAEVIKDTCLLADDLWLKCMELMNDVPVVLAQSNNYSVRNVWGTLNCGLANTNVEQNGNDIQLQNICKYFNLDLYKLVVNSKEVM